MKGAATIEDDDIKAINVSVGLVEFHKMDELPYYEFIAFTVKGNGPCRSQVTIVVGRYVGDVSSGLLGDAGTPELRYERTRHWTWI